MIHADWMRLRRSDRLFVAAMVSINNPSTNHCAWCGVVIQKRAELVEHEEEHRRATRAADGATAPTPDCN